jgi:hypothetical protein
LQDLITGQTLNLVYFIVKLHFLEHLGISLLFSVLYLIIQNLLSSFQARKQLPASPPAASLFPTCCPGKKGQKTTQQLQTATCLWLPKREGSSGEWRET